MTLKINVFERFLKENLNKDQLKAVKTKNHISLVIAGAGSGKTRIITSRIIHLILNEKQDPDTIIALTFTNRAAKEMKERVVGFLGDSHRLPFIGTFHAYALYLLKTNPTFAMFPQFSIIDEEDQLKIINKIIKKNKLDKKFSAKQIAVNISKLKNNNKSPEDIEDSILKDFFITYETEKKKGNCLDFNDLLLEGLRLFSNKQFKDFFQKKIRHVLVDEYQDTNVIQHELLKQFCKNKKKITVDSLCVVGDEDQSIYSWRGAVISNMMNFEKDFPKVEIIKIEKNYRSVQQILDVANNVIVNNKNRNKKKLWSEKHASDRVKILYCSSDYQEAEVVSSYLKIPLNRDNLNNIAILYRTHFQSRIIEESLIRNSIPYKIIGGIQFYDRKEIKDLIAYLKLIINPMDRMAFIRIINIPTRGLGNKFEEAFLKLWDESVLKDFKCIAKKILSKITNVKKKSLVNFLDVFKDLTIDTPPILALNQILNKSGYLQYLRNTYSAEEAENKIENVREFMRAIQYFEHENINSIALLLETIALMQEKFSDRENLNAKIQLMTLHSSKGLEFDTVIITGLEEGILPSFQSILQTDNVEEERRLFYVGITRARERLILTCSRYRNFFGQSDVQLISRFLEEIPNNLVPRKDCSFLDRQEIQDFFYNWMKIKKENNFASLKKLALPNEWKRNIPVKHKNFGIGIIEKIENKGADKIFVTVRFKSGSKKIDSKFLTII